MPSIYDKVFATLTKVLNTEPKHQMKVDAVKQAMQADPDFKRHASVLAAKYAEVRREMDTINQFKSECQVRLDAVFQLMCDQYDVEGTKSLTLSNGDVIRVQPKLYIGIPDPEAFRQWCLKSPDLQRKMVLHSSTASSLVAKMLLAGQPAPPGTKPSFVDQAVFKEGDDE